MEFESRSASVSEAERQIKSLQQENRRLKEELASVTTLYNQLVLEGKHENYDERRVTFLKSQLIQLERQLVMFSEALSGRSQVLMEVENNLMATADNMRAHLTQAQNEAKPGGVKVTLTKNDVELIIQTIESCRIKLYKNVENSTSEKLVRPVAMIDRFIKSDSAKPVTLLDVCSGKTDHLNLKHVAKLESRLSQVYRQLFVISKSLHSILTEDQSSKISHVNTAVYKSLGGQVAHACKLLEEVNQDLLTLSVLVPSAPWPLLSRPHINDLTSERVLATLPNFQKNKASEGKVMIEALMKAVNYSLQIKSLETDAMKQEIHMHQAIYKSQMEYTEALISSLMQGYASFEKETYELLCKPLQNILNNYNLLSTNADEESLRKFLESFKEQSAQISTAIDLFTPNESNKEAFSAYGEAFHESLQKIQRSCQKERDEKVSNLDELKDYLRKALDELKMMFPVLPTQGDEENPPHGTGNKVDGPATPARSKKFPLADEFANLSMTSELNSPDSGSRTLNKKDDDTDCTCGVVKTDIVGHHHGSGNLRNTPTSSRKLPVLKRPSTLPRLNRRGSQESSSGASSPIHSRESTPKLRSSSSIPSPTTFKSYSSPKGVSMKKLVLIPKLPKEKDEQGKSE